MKALILFDGSSTSFACIKAACQDAATLYENQPGQAYPTEPTEALLLLIKFSSDYEIPAGKACAKSDPARLLLEQGVRKVECSGEFDKVAGEIIVCAADNLTNVVQDRAREWKATGIYLALDPETTLGRTRPQPEKISWCKRLGFGKVEGPVETVAFEPQIPLTTAQVRVKQLLEKTHCRVVVVNSEGLAMKLSYYPPAARPGTSSKSYPAQSEFGHVA